MSMCFFKRSERTYLGSLDLGLSTAQPDNQTTLSALPKGCSAMGPVHEDPAMGQPADMDVKLQTLATVPVRVAESVLRDL